LKRFRDLNGYLREIFGERVHRISLDAGMSCPNRDGTISTQGCIFCDRRGSGTGALLDHGLSIEEQADRAREFIRRRYKARKFIAYFQSFTNTYAPVATLKTLYDRALAHRDMVGLSVGTRPDCVDGDILELLSTYRKDYLVWIEYGLQSAHDATLKRINRGHDVSCFERTVQVTREHDLNICVHVILGLPGEDREMMLQTARFLAALPIQGIKIHLLYVSEGTPLAELYHQGEIRCLDRGEYVELVADFLELLQPDTVIHRLTGDPVGSELVAPSWARDKTSVLKCIHGALERRGTWQGRLYEK